jgi:hypothetical protein
LSRIRLVFSDTDFNRITSVKISSLFNTEDFSASSPPPSEASAQSTGNQQLSLEIPGSGVLHALLPPMRESRNNADNIIGKVLPPQLPYVNAKEVPVEDKQPQGLPSIASLAGPKQSRSLRVRMWTNKEATADNTGERPGTSQPSQVPAKRSHSPSLQSGIPDSRRRSLDTAIDELLQHAQFKKIGKTGKKIESMFKEKLTELDLKPGKERIDGNAALDYFKEKGQKRKKLPPEVKDAISANKAELAVKRNIGTTAKEYERSVRAALAVKLKVGTTPAEYEEEKRRLRALKLGVGTTATAYNRYIKEQRTRKQNPGTTTSANPSPIAEVDSGVTSEVPIKLEPMEHDTFAFETEHGMEVVRLNAAQHQYVPTTTRITGIDLSGSGEPVVSTETVRDTDNAVTLTYQVYTPELEKVFPIRDPANPEHVHPAYADPDDKTGSRCAPGVKIRDNGVKFYKSHRHEINEGTLWNYAKTNFDTKLYKDKTMFINALTNSCREELQATIDQRNPPSCDKVEIIRLEERHCDNPREAKALKGKYGGVLKNYAPASQPSLRNAKIVCLFAACKLDSDKADDDYFGVFGERLGLQLAADYGANMRPRGESMNNQMTWTPYGGGNMGQYFNSSFLPGEGDTLVSSEEACNARFVPVTFELINAKGQPTEETMLAIVQYRPVADGKQLKLYYGPDYTLTDAAPAPASADDQELDDVIVKIEPMEID